MPSSGRRCTQERLIPLRTLSTGQPRKRAAGLKAASSSMGVEGEYHRDHSNGAGDDDAGRGGGEAIGKKKYQYLFQNRFIFLKIPYRCLV